MAEEDGAVVGHVQFSRTRIGETAVLALGPVGVVPDRQGRGVVSELIRVARPAEARLAGAVRWHPAFGEPVAGPRGGA